MGNVQCPSSMYTLGNAASQGPMETLYPDFFFVGGGELALISSITGT